MGRSFDSLEECALMRRSCEHERRIDPSTHVVKRDVPASVCGLVAHYVGCTLPV